MEESMRKRTKKKQAPVASEAFPEGSPLLFTEDLARTLRLTRGAVRKMLMRGECGSYLRIGRKLAVRRAAFLQALEAREISPVRSRGRPRESRKGSRASRDVPGRGQRRGEAS
jgi:hypothetical protein